MLAIASGSLRSAGRVTGAAPGMARWKALTPVPTALAIWGQAALGRAIDGHDNGGGVDAAAIGEADLLVIDARTVWPRRRAVAGAGAAPAMAAAAAGSPAGPCRMPRRGWWPASACRLGSGDATGRA